MNTYPVIPPSKYYTPKAKRLYHSLFTRTLKVGLVEDAAVLALVAHNEKLCSRHERRFVLLCRN